MEATVYGVSSENHCTSLGAAAHEQTGPAGSDHIQASATRSDLEQPEAGSDDKKASIDDRMDEVLDLIYSITTELASAYAELFNISAEERGEPYRLAGADLHIGDVNVEFIDPAMERLFIPNTRAT